MKFTGDTKAHVLARVRAADLQENPFPHMVIEEFLPEACFAEIDVLVPDRELWTWRGSRKANISCCDDDEGFARLPDHIRACWVAFRDELFGDTIGPALLQRFEDLIRHKYVSLYGSKVGSALMAAGLKMTAGRLMGRVSPHELAPHSDATQFGVTSLLYFSDGVDEQSGALMFYAANGRIELSHPSTFYPAEEGVVPQLRKVLPVRKNLFVAFLNREGSYHGYRLTKGRGTSPEMRIAYQAHLVSTGFRPELADGLPEVQRRRWPRSPAVRPT